MTKIYLLNKIVVVSAIIIICAISLSNGIISDKRLCYDEYCNEPISLARTLMRYNSLEPHILSFPTNTEVVIYSKEAGQRKDLWGAQIRGKRGYVPKSMVREYKVLKSRPTFEVPTEFDVKEINTTDEVKEAEIVPQNDENVDVKVKNTVNEVENVHDVANEIIEEKPKALEDANAENLKSETSTETTTPVTVFSDSEAKETVPENADKISESIQSSTPSYEVIDGTTIPLLGEPAAIKPSYSTPIIAATATVDEEPILSVHPKLPSNVRPLISRFSNADSKTIVKDELKSETEVVAENKTDKIGDSTEEPALVKDQGDISKIEQPVIVEESNITDDPKVDVNSNQSLDINAEPSDSQKPDESNKQNDQQAPNTTENDQTNKPQASDTPIIAPVDTNMDDPVGETPSVEPEAVQNVSDHIEHEDVISEKETVDKIDGDHLKSDLSSNEIDQRGQESIDFESEILNTNSSQLEGTIRENGLQDSSAQTEQVLDENMAGINKETNGQESVFIEKAVINETKIPLTNETAEHNDNRVVETDSIMKDDEDSTFHNTEDVQSESQIEDGSQSNLIEETSSQNDSITTDDENFTVHNTEDVQAESQIEDSSQNNSAEETSSQIDDLIPASEEVTTKFYSYFDDDKVTTARSLLTVDETVPNDDNQSSIETSDVIQSYGYETQSSQEYENDTYYNEVDSSIETPELETTGETPLITSFDQNSIIKESPQEVCDIYSDCADLDNGGIPPNQEENGDEEDQRSHSSSFDKHNYVETLLYVSITALTTLLFSLGYYYIENHRRDKELVAKINLLEKELLVTTKESMILGDGWKATKDKLNSIEDESFGSNEMVVSLKSELEAAQTTKEELEDQIISLEKELESATEAGLELERMLREFLASQSDENPLAQSVEDLQTRLNAQQATNESLTNSLNLKSQENEALTNELATVQERCQQLEVEVTRISGELKMQSNLNINAEKEFSAIITQLKKQVNKLSEDRAGLITQLTTKDIAVNDLTEVIKQQGTNNLDFEKLYDVSYIKAEAELVTKERDELKTKLAEVEGAHQLLEEHMKLIKEEIASVTEQYELAERDKTEAQTRLEVLSNYFKEKESQLQKELGMQEAMWVQKQGEVTSTVDRIQTMQNEIQNYRQQIETLKREILDQEREYKSQIAALETKSHEQWVIARQSERRLEESKAEASQLRNRLTMVEKSINEVDSDSKLHRSETNGETASSPQLFMGGESSSSPIIFSGSSGVPPLPPPFMYGGIPPPFIPPPPHSGGGPIYDISRRPPPLGGRLSSPPPIPPLHHPPGRYDDTTSPPPPLSPPLHPPYNHRSPPPFSNERIHPHPPPPFLTPLGTSHSWGDEPLPPLRNPAFHPHQRDQRIRNHKGSLHSSGDSLDKTNHTGKS